MYIDDLLKTRKGPGITIRGKPNARVDDVFRELTVKLVDFYAQKNHFYRAPDYIRGERSYETPVYSLDNVKLLVHQTTDTQDHVEHRDSHTEAKPVLRVKIIEQKKQVKRSYTPRGDFPEKAHVAEIARFLVYFNARKTEIGTRHRDDFFDYFKRTSVH